MKYKLTTLLALAATVITSNAVVTFSGTAFKQAYGSTPTTQVGSGVLGLVIVDTGSDGFLGHSFNGSLTVTSDPGVLSSSASATLGGTFGGDLVIGRLTSGVLSGNTNFAFTGMSNLDTSTYSGKNFAIVWFDTGTTPANTTGNVANGTKFGIVSGSNWQAPASSPGGTFNVGTAFTAITDGSTSTAAQAGQSVVFSTYGTTFTVVPEPSAALLGAFGVLGLLRRRRN